MPHFDDPNVVAQFLNNINLTINNTSRGDFSPEHLKYECTLSYGENENNPIIVNYQSNPRIHGKPSLTDIMTSLTFDAMSAADYDIESFAENLDITNPIQLIEIYKKCHEVLDWIMGNICTSREDIGILNETLEEYSDEIKETLMALTAQKKADFERTHPKVPQGFVTIDDLQEELDLGECGNQCIDFWADDIADRLDDIANDNVDIYNDNLFEWLPKNYGWIEEAYQRGLLEGTDGNILKMIQIAQHEYFVDDIRDHVKDICKYVTLESLKDAGIYAVSEEVADTLDEMNYLDEYTFSALLNRAKGQIQDIIAANFSDMIGDKDRASEIAKELVVNDNYTANPSALSVEGINDVNVKGLEEVVLDRWKQEIGETEQETSKSDTPDMNPEVKLQYMILSRLKSDCDYYVGACSKNLVDMKEAQKHLYTGNIEEQITKMREIYDTLPQKPEWLSIDDINRYEKRMLDLRDGEHAVSCASDMPVSIKSEAKSNRMASEALANYESHDYHETNPR